jgi:glycine/D-amino acid oxidase-like deaminating enzyme
MGAPTASRVAVIGSGVSALTAAWILAAAGREVTLYEAAPRLGGHADTHQVTAPGGTLLGIDTGFIVPNTRTYPLLTRLSASSAWSAAVRDEHVGALPGLRPGVRRAALAFEGGRMGVDQILLARPVR